MNATRQGRGVILMRPVGIGHTAMDLLTPLLFADVQCAAYITPPALVEGVIAQHGMLRASVPVPSIVVHGMRNLRFHSWISPLGPTLHVIPSSLLARADSGSFLENLLPDMVIANEGARVTQRHSVRAWRVAQYLREHPNTRYLFWTDYPEELR